MQSTAGPSSSMDNIKTVKLHNPDPDKLKEVLECGLREMYFTEITLEWIDQNTCPDLTKGPFNLAAPRICGNTAVLDVGDLSYWQPKPDVTKEYDIEKLLKSLNYNEKNFFIFGNGFAYRSLSAYPYKKLSELVMNQSFLPADRVDPNVNKNCFTYIPQRKKHCYVEMFKNPDTVPKCYMKGTFFLCDGIASKILKIHTKADTLIVKSPFDFIDSMQNALHVKHGINGENIVLGGIYKVNNRHGWSHVVTRNDWKISSLDTIQYDCRVRVLEAIISIFNSSTGTPTPYCPGSSSIKLNAIQSTHCLSYQYAFNLHGYYANDVVEFTGYFSPAQKLFRVDEPIIQAAQ